LWKRIDNGDLRSLPAVDTGVTPANALGGAQRVEPGRSNDEQTTTIDGHRRIAYCECGAQLAGDSEEELFEAAQQHLAHHHPQLLGALGVETVNQMAEDVGGIDAYGRPGA
jgi:hypothetical protein